MEKELFSSDILKHKKREIKVQHTGKQYSVRIPLIFAEDMKLKKGEVLSLEYDKDKKEILIKK